MVVVVPPSLACETTLALLMDFHLLMYVIASKQLQLEPRSTVVY